MKGEQNRQTDIPHSSSYCCPFLLVMFSFSKSRVAKDSVGSIGLKGKRKKKEKRKESLEINVWPVYFI